MLKVTMTLTFDQLSPKIKHGSATGNDKQPVFYEPSPYLFIVVDSRHDLDF